MSRSRLVVRCVPFVVMLHATGCATISATVDPWAREAAVTAGAAVILSGKVSDVTIYGEDGSPLKMVMVQNPSAAQAISNAVRQSAAQSQANQVGSATYTQSMTWAPAIYLKQKQTHRLHIVHRDGRSVDHIAKPHVRKSVFAIDWILAVPTFFTSLLIDWSTGKWQAFDPVDVDKLFQNSGAQRPGLALPEVRGDSIGVAPD